MAARHAVTRCLRSSTFDSTLEVMIWHVEGQQIETVVATPPFPRKCIRAVSEPPVHLHNLDGQTRPAIWPPRDKCLCVSPRKPSSSCSSCLGCLELWVGGGGKTPQPTPDPSGSAATVRADACACSLQPDQHYRGASRSLWLPSFQPVEWAVNRFYNHNEHWRLATIQCKQPLNLQHAEEFFQPSTRDAVVQVSRAALAALPFARAACIFFDSWRSTWLGRHPGLLNKIIVVLRLRANGWSAGRRCAAVLQSEGRSRF